MLIILFIMFTIIEVVLEMLGIIDTEYENCFEIVVSSAIFPRNKSPPLKWHSNTLTFRQLVKKSVVYGCYQYLIRYQLIILYVQIRLIGDNNALASSLIYGT